jgi:hypothetical protein
MSKLTDLEICKRIAEIEGFEFRIQNGKVLPENPAEAITGKLTDVYNPLTDDALCFKLMIKYDIAPFKCEFGGYECVYDVDLVLSGSGVVNDENANRAICIAIIHLREE